MEVANEEQMYLHRLVIGVEGEVVQGSIEEVLHQRQQITLLLHSQPELML